MDRRVFLGSALATGAGLMLPRAAMAAVPNSSNGYYVFDRNLPDATHTRVLATMPKCIAEIAFTPSGGWVVVGGNGAYEASGTPQECFDKLVEFVDAGDKINCIAFPPEGGNRWVIVTETGLFARNIPQACFDSAVAMLNAGNEIYRIAFGPSGAWVILASEDWDASGVSNELETQIGSFQSSQTTWPEQVAFTPSGGWVLVGRRGYFARNIPDECFTKLGACVTAGFRVTRVAFSPSGGWHVSGNDRVNLPATSGGLSAVRTTMANNNIPGLAAVVVRGNAISVSHYYGYNQRGSSNAVNVSTRFQCASISKAVTAAGVMRLLQLGTVTGLTLDTDIRGDLGVTLGGTSAPTSAVTLRQLLTHTAGFNVHGFGGYRRTVTPPNTLGVLNGTGNSAAVSRRAADGAVADTWLWQYSGGGLTVVQRYIERVTGQAFGAWMWTNLLSPAGMTSSRFILDPTWGETSLAAAHNADGYVVAHRRNRYPELAAAGLYVTAADLARFVIAVNRGGLAPNGTRLWATDMLAGTNYTATDGGTRRMGLGVFLGTEGANAVHWEHNGVNWGFRGHLWGNALGGNGVVVLANGDVPSSVIASVKNNYVSTYAL